ncbi:hypothetical protein Bca4012_052863 [Brassica carinata]
MSTKENGVLSNGCSQRPRKRATSLSWWLSVTKENGFDQEARSRLNLSLCQTKPQRLFVKVERVHVGKQSRSKDVAVKSGVVVSVTRVLFLVTMLL